MEAGHLHTQIAKQVEREFAATGPTLRIACVYGGHVKLRSSCRLAFMTSSILAVFATYLHIHRQS